MLIPCADIIVPKGRQRSDLGDLSELKASLARLGLINPITVTPPTEAGWTLLAGERRLRAATELGWKSIEAFEFADLSEHARVLVELEENIRRKQLSWPEEVLAIKRFYDLGGKTIEETAKDLLLSAVSVTRQIRLAGVLVARPDLKSAGTWSSAYQMLMIQVAKQGDSLIESLVAEELEEDSEPEPELEPEAEPESESGSELGPELGQGKRLVSGVSTAASRGAVMVAKTSDAQPPARSPVAPKPFSAIQADFCCWAPEYVGRRFNLLHCDFPYGLNMDKARLQNSADRWDNPDVSGRFEDSPELFERLCRTFFDHQDKFVSETAHCIFWLAAKNYGRLASRFVHYGWAVCETALIWHKSDNAGIAPDVNRWPRRTYEMAIFASRGDRKLVRLKAASFSSPTTKEYHLSEKPLAVVGHFLSMVCDEHSEILDPTVGSGTALESARGLGAIRGLGLDTNGEFAKVADLRCASHELQISYLVDPAGRAPT